MRFPADNTKGKRDDARLDASAVGIGAHLEVFPRVREGRLCARAHASRTKEAFGGSYSPIRGPFGVSGATWFCKGQLEPFLSGFVKVLFALCRTRAQRQADQARRVIVDITLRRAIDAGRDFIAGVKERGEVLAMRLQRQQGGNKSECVFHGAEFSA